MRKSAEFIDYYELLEVSPHASRETIERVFRYMAKRSHSDSSDQADTKHFSQLVEACEKLTNPESRALYDIAYENQKQQIKQLVEETGYISSDCADRHKLLSLFYAQRRRNRKQPGIGPTTVEQVMGLPPEILEFHLWYFREKGWIDREECGLLSITSAGVDQIEATVQTVEIEKFKRLEFNPSSVVPALPSSSSVGNQAETTDHATKGYVPQMPEQPTPLDPIAFSS